MDLIKNQDENDELKNIYNSDEKVKQAINF
jgi:hypothetical protein